MLRDALAELQATTYHGHAIPEDVGLTLQGSPIYSTATPRQPRRCLPACLDGGPGHGLAPQESAFAKAIGSLAGRSTASRGTRHRPGSLAGSLRFRPVPALASALDAAGRRRRGPVPACRPLRPRWTVGYCQSGRQPLGRVAGPAGPRRWHVGGRGVQPRGAAPQACWRPPTWGCRTPAGLVLMPRQPQGRYRLQHLAVCALARRRPGAARPPPSPSAPTTRRRYRGRP